LSFLLLVYVFSSTKLEKREEQVLPGSKGVRGACVGAGGRNDPNNVCTYEHMNKEKILPSLHILFLPKLSSVDLHSDLPILLVFCTA
jgi:hypothetical protein